MGQIMRRKDECARRTVRWRDGEKDGRRCDRTRAGSGERGKSMNEGVTSSRPLLTPQPRGPEELRAGEGMGGEGGRSWGRFGMGGGDIDVARRRWEGGGGWGSADHPRTVKEAFSLLFTTKPENMWSITVKRQIYFTSILTSAWCTCLSVFTNHFGNCLSFSIFCTSHIWPHNITVGAVFH